MRILFVRSKIQLCLTVERLTFFALLNASISEEKYVYNIYKRNKASNYRSSVIQRNENLSLKGNGKLFSKSRSIHQMMSQILEIQFLKLIYSNKAFHSPNALVLLHFVFRPQTKELKIENGTTLNVILRMLMLHFIFCFMLFKVY